MSFESEYLKALYGTSKKKKKEEDESFESEYEAELKNATGDTIDDIAPVRSDKGSKESGGGRSGSFSKEALEEKEKEEAENRTWFEGSGAFENGYQFGDVFKTIGGTYYDMKRSLDAGLLGIGESAIDTAATLIGGVGKVFGADKFADAVSGFVEKDIINEKKVAEKILQVTESMPWSSKEIDSYSVFGDKTDSLIESGGQLGGQIMLQALGVPWFVTSGTTSFGKGAEEAFKEDASYGEAVGSAAISAGAEILTEKLFGGSGLGEKGLINVDLFTSKVASKTVKTLLDFGIDVAGEGAEEVVSSVFSRLGSALYKEESIKDLLLSEEAFDEYLESFIGGAVLGGGMNVGKAVSSINSGRDYRSGLTSDEEAVINKEVEKRITEQEKNGKKLSESEKKKITEAVKEDLDKGYISIDTIEEVLGGDSYKSYQDTVKNEDALKSEFEELEKVKTNDATLGQSSRYNELKNKLAELETTSQRSILERKYKDDAYEVAKGSRLESSYFERARGGEAFTADLSKYDEKQRATIQSAIDAGFLNNRGRTHDFVNLIAKIAADKGVTFDFLNNEKLKTSGFAVGGATVNGYYDKKSHTIGINFNSNKALNTTVGHEITHVLEGTEIYGELQTALIKYAKAKGEYKDRVKDLRKIYGVKNIDTELVADLVGDYLFTDADFINRLSTEHRNVFQKVFDEIKYLYKTATAGSKEARELEKVKRVFEKAYRENIESQNETDTDEEAYDDVQYSKSVEDKATLDSLNEQVSRGEYDPVKNPNGGYYVTYKSMSFWGYDENGNAILRSPMAEYVDGELSNAYLIPKDKSKLNWYQATETMDEATGLPSGLMVKTKKPGNKAYSYVPAAENQDLIDDDWSNLYFILKKKVLKNGKWKDSDVPARYNPYEHSSNSMLNDQFSSAYLRDNLVTVKMYVPVSEDKGAYRAQWSKDPTGWADWKTGTVAGKINKQKDLQRRVYLSRYAAPVEIVPDSEVAQAYKGYLEGTDVSIPDNVVSPNLLNELKKAGVPITESGNVKYSLSTDSDGNALSDGQKEFFKDSKVKDENGYLMVMYHGTPNGDFTVFNDGTYFTASKEYADKYQNPGASSLNSRKVASSPKTFEVYLNITKPFDINDPEARRIYINDYIKGGNAIGINPYLSDAEYDKIDTIDWTEGEDLREFLIENGYDYDGLVLDEGAVGGYGEDVEYRGKSYVVFSPEQVKNIDNAKPTSNPDIRFSLSKAVEETNDLMAIHNLTEEKLLKSLKLGGLPMPSVAIARARDGHDTFGDVSLILPKETIDPKRSKANKVYGGDAWTPVYPSIEYKVSEKAQKAVEAKINSLVPRDVQKALGNLSLDYENMKSAINRHNGNVYNEYGHNPAMQYAFLVENGFSEQLPTTEKQLDGSGRFDNSVIIDAVEKIGASEIERFANEDIWGNDALIAQLRDIANEYTRAKYKGDSRLVEILRNRPLYTESNFGFAQADSIIRAANKYVKNGVEQTVDYKEAGKIIENAVDEAVYRKWLDDLFSGIIEKEGIRNNADTFTPSGNRRSWEALHWENTLENVVRAMKAEGEKGIGVFGGGNIFGASTMEYNSIKDIKDASDRLQNLSDEEYSEIKQGFNDRFFELANRLPKSDSYSAIEDAKSMLVEAVVKYNTRSGMDAYLRRESQGWANYSEDIVDDLISLVNDIKSMPTRYFEAKPRRAVGFDEVGVFVIPNNADAKLKQELLNRGYSIAEYDPNVEGDRQKVVNSFEEYKFSLSDVGEAPQEYGSYNVYGRDMTLREEVAPTEEDIAPVTPTESVQNNVQTPAENVAIKNAIEDIYKRNGWDKPSPNDGGVYADPTDITAFVDGILTQWDVNGSIKGNALHRLLDESAIRDEYGIVENDIQLAEIIEGKLREHRPEFQTESEPELPYGVENEIASYKQAIAEKRVNAKGNKKASTSGLKKLVKAKPKIDPNSHGVLTVNGKQYWSCNGYIFAEMNTPEEGVPEKYNLAVATIWEKLSVVKRNVLEGDYKIDPIDIDLIRKQVPNDGAYAVLVGEDYFDLRYVDAVLKAIENPTISLGSLNPKLNALLVDGSNGRAVVAPMRPGKGLRCVYKASEVQTTPPSDIAPVASTENVQESTISELNAIAPDTPVSALYSKDSSDRGWGKGGLSSSEAIIASLKYVNPDLLNAYAEELDRPPEYIDPSSNAIRVGSMPILDAICDLADVVRQDTISPMQAVMIMSKAYNEGGIEGLKNIAIYHDSKAMAEYAEGIEREYNSTVANEATDSLPDDIAPITEDEADSEALDNVADEDIAPIAETTVPAADKPIQTVKERLEAKLQNSNTELTNNKQSLERAIENYDKRIAELKAQYDGKKNKDTKVANNLLRRIERLTRLRGDVIADYQKRIGDIESRVGNINVELTKDHSKVDRLESAYAKIDSRLEQDKAKLLEDFQKRKAEAQESVADKNGFIKNRADELYWELTNLKKGVRASKELGYLLDHGYSWSEIKTALVSAKMHPDGTLRQDSVVENVVREALNEEYEDRVYSIDEMDNEYNQEVKRLEDQAEKEKEEARKAEQTIRRIELHSNIVDNVKTKFSERGFDFDEVLKGAKNLSTFATVDNTPQRVMEKSLGYKEGQILSDLTVDQVARNESEGIKWLNSVTNKKDGLLAQLVKKYGIKPGSKASAAAQMYAEGFFVDTNGDVIKYGDAELAKDFPNEQVRQNIIGLARDQRVRQFYDETLDKINESRVRNAYPEIQKLDNYFLHFRAMEDTFSRLGLPFNPNDIKAKDLPTDLNGVTADLKPGQPYFASARHREGIRTSHDLLGGLERYASSAKNQIYHIDDIQTLRAIRNYIADGYGQAKGLESLDSLTEEEAQEKIKQVYGSHLSTFAKFLNEEANVIAGKTALIDRGLEGIIGRRGITLIDTINKQVGANMVGFNVSSSLTNFIPVAQTFAKSNKFDFTKAFAQTASNKINSIFGRSDEFIDNNPTVLRRRGADRFYQTPYQKVGDIGYTLMGVVDDISTELIVRTKYNEYIRKGMSEQDAVNAADKWTSRLMADRSLGQMPQIYNSRMLGLFTKFQLEVRNQLDAQFYDTIQEKKVSNEDIENGLLRNAKTAAQVTSTFAQLAIAQHLYGMAFEAIAGYNPAFDIVSVLATALGFDDDEDDEDTVLDNLGQGFLELLEDLPYTSALTGGGRIPISSALPVEDVLTAIRGQDANGNEISRKDAWKTVGEAAPYYFMPGGYGQLKKTLKGMEMFDEDLPIAGSYTDSGKLRYPVDDTVKNRLQAAIFGQYANENAGKYFDGGHKALDEKQIQEFIDVDIPIEDYWDYREGLYALNKKSETGTASLAEKIDYIMSLDLPIEKKNLLANNLTERKEPIDLTGYEEYGNYKDFDFAKKYPEKYAFLQDHNISVSEYEEFDEDTKEAYTWASKNPAKYKVSKAISDDLLTYRSYTDALYDIKADKDEDGKSISGSRKEKVINYINNLDADYGQKIILFKSEYPTDDTYNYEIIDYLNGRDDISYSDMVTILTELGFKVEGDNVYWD